MPCFLFVLRRQFNSMIFSPQNVDAASLSLGKSKMIILLYLLIFKLIANLA